MKILGEIVQINLTTRKNPIREAKALQTLLYDRFSHSLNVSIIY
jgi:hypothetical protein